MFVNCPFDERYAPLLESLTFCIVYFGFTPRLASERLEAGENRLDKIIGMMKGSKYSIHDLSRSTSSKKGEPFRMNMPFEYGLDVGLRQSRKAPFNRKKFLIFEEYRYDLKRSFSDIGGQDVEYHNGTHELVIKKVRNFFRVEAGVAAAGPSRLISDYSTFQGWMTEKKIDEGHSEREALALPTSERVDEMRAWVKLGKPARWIV